jgi:hypothetical protein
MYSEQELVSQVNLITLYKEGALYTRNTHVPAMTANELPACAARVDTVPSTSAPPELLPDGMVVLPAEALAAVATPEANWVAKPDREATSRGDSGGELDPAEGLTEGPALERCVTEVLFVLVPVDVVFPPVGAATALEGSTRAPIPQGMAWPLG